jgi:hypothetical protein
MRYTGQDLAVLLIHNQLALTMVGNHLLREPRLFARASPDAFEARGARKALSPLDKTLKM